MDVLMSPSAGSARAMTLCRDHFVWIKMRQKSCRVAVSHMDVTNQCMDKVRPKVERVAWAMHMSDILPIICYSRKEVSIIFNPTILQIIAL